MRLQATIAGVSANNGVQPLANAREIVGGPPRMLRRPRRPELRSMAFEPHTGSVSLQVAEFSGAERERRSRRNLVALALVVPAAVVVLTLSLRSFDSGVVGQPTAVVDFEREPASLEEFARRPAFAAPSSAAPESDDAGQPPAAPRPARESRKQSEFLAEFRALADETAFLAAVEAALSPDRPPAQSMAALLASYERLGELSTEHFTRAALDLTASSVNAESVARASIDWLGRRAESEPAARAVLERLAVHGKVEPVLRAASGFALVRAAPLEELARLESLLLRDPHEHVRQSVGSELDARHRKTHDASPRHDDP